jgi:competence protein ComEA
MIRTLFALLIAAFALTAHAAVDVNKSSQAELETIKGIGPSMSGRMLDERKKGSFKDWPDMVGRVKGIGQGNAGKFAADGLTVNGSGFKPELLASSKPATRTDKKHPAVVSVETTAARK